MASLSKGREAALKVLVAVEKDGAYLNIAIRDILKSSDDVRDNALSMQLAFGVTKNKLFIDNIIENISTVKLKKLSVWIHNILRIGIYSIKFLDRIPVSATVSECVKLSRRYGHSASSGFVNAVLRKASSSGDFLPKDKESAKYYSIRYSLPLWLTNHWLSEGYGEDFFKAMNETPPTTVRLNTLRAKELGKDFTKVSGSENAYSYIGSGSVENTQEYKTGLITVQDAASQKAIELLGIKEGMQVLDLCAAPGGKTTYAAQKLGSAGRVVSCDIHNHKLALIEANAKRLGIENVSVIQNDALVPKKDFENAFDRVIADVPCSGLGIIRRKPDIKWTKTEEEISSLIPIQQEILHNASLYVKKGGRLLYSTCTVNRSENEENVLHFLKNHSDFSLADECQPSGIQFTPHLFGTDGFFVAVFERK